MSLHLRQFRNLIIKPTLEQFNLDGPAATQLVEFTIAAESIIGETQFIKQTNGPALGIIQMEPATHDWLKHYITQRSDRFTALINWIQHTGGYNTDRLIYDLKYQVIMCRIRYLTVPAALPEAYDWDNIAAYWKKYYNTPAGAGNIAKALAKANMAGVMA